MLRAAAAAARAGPRARCSALVCVPVQPLRACARAQPWTMSTVHSAAPAARTAVWLPPQQRDRPRAERTFARPGCLPAATAMGPRWRLGARVAGALQALRAALPAAPLSQAAQPLLPPAAAAAASGVRHFGRAAAPPLPALAGWGGAGAAQGAAAAAAAGAAGSRGWGALRGFAAGADVGLKAYKPTTPGQRGRVTTSRKELWKGRPLRALTKARRCAAPRLRCRRAARPPAADALRLLRHPTRRA
jgi:hypothetical protein